LALVFGIPQNSLGILSRQTQSPAMLTPLIDLLEQMIKKGAPQKEILICSLVIQAEIGREAKMTLKPGKDSPSRNTVSQAQRPKV
jgi:hypothetical protein